MKELGIGPAPGWRRHTYGEGEAGLIADARRIARSLGLELVVRQVGYGDLERRLVAIVDGREQSGAGAGNRPASPRGRLRVRRIGAA